VHETADALRRLIYGFRTTQLVAVAAQLGIADALHDGPRTSASMAEAARVDAAALHRVLRALTSLGVLAETSDGRFASTPLSELLTTESPKSMRDVASLYAEPWLWQTYGQLMHSVRTGESAFAHVHGQFFYDFLGSHPDEAAAFNRTMSGFTAHEVAAIVEACELSRDRTVVDVGGGHGALVIALLRRHHQLSGIVLERADVAAGALRALHDAGLATRCECVPGDFFQGVPGGADVYFLKSVLHNWRDDAAVRILRACRAAMHERSRVVIAERLIEPGNAEAALVDINMLVTVGGLERTPAEYDALLHSAGLRRQSIAATTSALSLIEAVPAL